MARNGTTTIEVEHNGATIAVPTEFSHDDVAAYFGVDFPVTIDRIFRHDGHVRAESYSGDEYVEVGYFPEGGHSDTLDAGWIADNVTGVDPADVRERGADNLGETLWVRED